MTRLNISSLRWAHLGGTTKVGRSCRSALTLPTARKTTTTMRDRTSLRLFWRKFGQSGSSALPWMVVVSTYAPLRLLAIIVTGLLASRGQSAQLLDDRSITIHSTRDVAEKRRALIQYLWGTEGFPDRRLPNVVTNVASPVQHLDHLARVDEFRIDLAPGLQGVAYHFIPQHPNRELVVVHHGHACTLDDDPSPKDVGYGLQRTINAVARRLWRARCFHAAPSAGRLHRRPRRDVPIDHPRQSHEILFGTNGAQPELPQVTPPLRSFPELSRVSYDRAFRRRLDDDHLRRD